MANDRIRAREADIKAFIARLDKFLYRNLDNILGDIQSGSIDGVEAAKVLLSLETSLKQLGLDKELGQLQGIYATELRQIKSSYNDIGFKGQIFSDTDRDVIKNLITFDTNKTAANINRYIGNVQSVIMQSVLTGDTPDFSAVHDRFGDALESNLDAELNTSLAAFDRTVTVNKATDLGLDLFEYMGPGPDDKKIRPFCKACLEGGGSEFHIPSRDVPIYTIDEIKNMDNEQGLDVLTYGGGYNCRHRWNAITRDHALEIGYKEPN